MTAGRVRTWLEGVGTKPLLIEPGVRVRIVRWVIVTRAADLNGSSIATGLRWSPFACRSVSKAGLRTASRLFWAGLFMWLFAGSFISTDVSQPLSRRSHHVGSKSPASPTAREFTAINKELGVEKLNSWGTGWTVAPQKPWFPALVTLK